MCPNVEARLDAVGSKKAFSFLDAASSFSASDLNACCLVRATSLSRRVSAGTNVQDLRDSLQISTPSRNVRQQGNPPAVPRLRSCVTFFSFSSLNSSPVDSSPNLRRTE